MVLIFFMLSGYVIGLSTNTLSGFSIKEYGVKRLVRLYPIYILAIVLTVIFFSENWHSVLGTLFFCQLLFTNNIGHNGPLWSLNHEVVYYLLAIPILRFKINIKLILALLIILIFVCFRLDHLAIIEGYVTGFFFWCTGLALTKLPKEDKPINYNALLSLLFLLLTYEYLNGAGDIVNAMLARFDKATSISKHNMDTVVNFSDLGSYVICLVTLCSFASVRLKGLKFMTYALYALSWFTLTYFIYKGSYFHSNIFYVPSFFLVVSTFLFFYKKPIITSLSRLSFIGTMSYALYVMHMPILYIVGLIPQFRGSDTSYLVRVLVCVAIIFPLSYWLERMIQPKIKKWVDSKRKSSLAKV